MFYKNNVSYYLCTHLRGNKYGKQNADNKLGGDPEAQAQEPARGKEENGRERRVSQHESTSKFSDDELLSDFVITHTIADNLLSFCLHC